METEEVKLLSKGRNSLGASGSGDAATQCFESRYRVPSCHCRCSFMLCFPFSVPQQFLMALDEILEPIRPLGSLMLALNPAACEVCVGNETHQEKEPWASDVLACLPFIWLMMLPSGNCRRTSRHCSRCRAITPWKATVCTAILWLCGAPCFYEAAGISVLCPLLTPPGHLGS